VQGRPAGLDLARCRDADDGGPEVCTRLKADAATRNIPVIFVTSHTDASEQTRGLELGAVDFIARPVDPAVVRARVKTHLTLKAQSDLLRQMVFIDGSTGVANRRCFDERLASEWRRAARNAAPLALPMVDVDHFKRYDDRDGHQVGDECLRHLARAIQANLLRPGGLVARLGGEEFACIAVGDRSAGRTDLQGALTLAADIEQSVRRLQIEHADSDTAKVVTLGLGVSMCLPQPEGDAADLLAMADTQLYRAKHSAKHSGRAQACGAELQGQGQRPRP